MNFKKTNKRKYELVKTRTNDYTARSDDDEPTVIPIDPGQLMSSMFSKSDDIKTDGNKIYFYKDISVETVLKLNTTLSEMAKKLEVKTRAGELSSDWAKGKVMRLR